MAIDFDERRRLLSIEFDARERDVGSVAYVTAGKCLLIWRQESGSDVVDMQLQHEMPKGTNGGH